MKKMFDYSSWIWSGHRPKKDEYAEFYDRFSYTGEEGVSMYISADSNYAVYVNGALAACGQYADYPYDKVYDKLDLTNYCKRGENHLAIVVWYYGDRTLSVYYLGQAALRYTLWEGDRRLCCSSRETQSRKSRAYRNHAAKKITGQLGYTFAYHAADDDGWMLGKGEDMHDSVLVAQNPPLRERPCKRPEIGEAVLGREICRLEDGAILYDLGREEVGLLTLSVESKCEQTVTVAYGEHIVDGRVRRIIGKRDFSVEYGTGKGDNEYTNPFRRLACRYLEIKAQYPEQLCVKKIGILPQTYPLTEVAPPALNETEQRIYDACIRTLRLCMHEHYEDCPWREQALYAMDSRNQILCGYYAFEEFEFPRANLELMAHDRRADGLLNICCPASVDLAIPSFSLHYVTEAYEYLQYSGDRTLLKEIYPKLKSIVEVFLGQIKDGVVMSFAGKWNFYEWRDGLANSIHNDHTSKKHLVLNCLLARALGYMAKLAETFDPDMTAESAYLAQKAALLHSIRATFYDAEKGVFRNGTEDDSYSQLGNALAILCGAIEGEEARALANRIMTDADMTPTSLSMQCFTYDALLAVSKEFAPFILSDIERIYLPMLEGGTGTVWETEEGESDFGNAGSLCHGWSAMPVYYYHILKR